MKKTQQMIRVEREFGKPIEQLLKEDYMGKGLSTWRIAERYGVAQLAIRQWLLKSGIKPRDFREAQFHRRGKKVVLPSDGDLRKWYVEEWKPSTEIARTLGVSSDTVREWLKNAGIHLRHGNEAMGYTHQRPSPEILRKWYIDEKKSTLQIGKIVGVSYMAVNNWLRQAGIPIRTKRRQKIIHRPTADELHRMYVVEKMSAPKIAKIFGVTETAILLWMKKAGIKRRSHREKVFAYLGKEVRVPSKEELYEWYVRQRKSSLQIANELGTTASTVCNWLNEWGIPVREDYYSRMGYDFEKPSPEQLYKWYIVENKDTGKIGQIVGVERGTISRWLHEAGIKPRDNRAAQFIRFRGRVIERPPNEQLRKWYVEEKKSTIQIANILGTTYTTINHWLEEAGIERDWRRSMGYDHIQRPSDAVLRELYVTQRLSTIKIAKKLGISEATAKEWLDQAGIPLRKLSDARFAHFGKIVKEPSEEQLREWYLQRRMTLAEIAAMFGIDGGVVSRWLHRYGIPVRESKFGDKEWKVTEDGHRVRSGYERRACNWLRSNGIPHSYNSQLPKSNFRCDFKVGDVYIEILGLQGKEDYDEKTRRKSIFYESMGLRRIDLYPDDFDQRNSWVKKLEPLLVYAESGLRKQARVTEFAS